MAASIGFDIFARDRASRVFDRVGASAERAGRRSDLARRAVRLGAIGLATGLASAATAGVKFAEWAAEDETSARALAVQLRNSAGATDKQVASTEAWITKMGKARGVTDDDLRPALSKLVVATHDVGKSQKLASLAMDVSAGTGKDLGTVSQALARAYTGNVGALGRLGFATKDSEGKTKTFLQLQKELATQFKGQSKAAAGTFAGQLERSKVQLRESGEALGYKFIPYLTKGADALRKDIVPAVTEFIDEMSSGKGAGGDFADALHTVADDGKKVAKVAGQIYDKWESIPGSVKKTAGQVAILAGGIGAALSVAKKLKGALSLGKGAASVLSGGKVGGSAVGTMTVKAGVVNVIGGKGVPGTDSKVPKVPPAVPAAGAGAGAGAFLLGGAIALGSAGAVTAYGMQQTNKLPKSVQNSVQYQGSPYGGVSGVAPKLPSKKDMDALDKQLKAFKSFTGPVIKAGAFNWVDQAVGKLGTLNSAMHKLPKSVQTQISAPGADITKKKALDLARQYGLTPDEVRTLVEADGTPKAKAAIKGVSDVMSALSKARAKPTVDLRDSARSKQQAILNSQRQLDASKANPKVSVNAGNSQSLLNNVWNALNRLHDRNINVTTHYATTGKPLRDPRADQRSAGRAGDPMARAAEDMRKKAKGKGVSVPLTAAGASLLSSLVAGITVHSKKAKTQIADALSAVQDEVQRRVDKLNDLRNQFSDFSSGFSSGFGSSIFDDASYVDAEGNAAPITVDQILGAQQNKAAAAQSLNEDVTKLLGEGLSEDLLRQLQAQGNAGVNTIRALASGATASQISQLNAYNAQTSASLKAAGDAIAQTLYGGEITATVDEVAIANAVVAGLVAAGVGTVTLDGTMLNTSIVKAKKKHGQKH